MAVFLVASAVACATTQPLQTASAEDGARIWRSTCARCHNARSPSEFYARQWTVIANHMRTHAALTRTQAASVAAFLSASASSSGVANSNQD
jgi:mono/diheme cytochrome c family protein